MSQKEIRTWEGSEIRAVDSDDGPAIEGYAVRWDSLSQEMGGFRERFTRGAFADSLKDGDVRVIWQHDGKYVFGRMKSGTARVWEDDKGLAFRSTIPDAQWARDAAESIRRGDVDQNSFAFLVEDRAKDVQWEERDGVAIRTVKKAQLFEVGPQTAPAYLDTKVALRSLEEARTAGAVEGADIPPAPKDDVRARELEKLRLADAA